MTIIPPKPEIDFTDELLTSKGGITFLACFASYLGLPKLIEQNIKLKRRNRDPSDSHYLLSLIYSIALGEGNLCDVDLLKQNFAQKTLIGLKEVPDSRKVSEFIHYQPAGCREEETYVVVRQKEDGRQGRIFPRYQFILVSREDLGLTELVRRHRQKQGQENILKGPLRDLGLHHPPCQRFVANQAYYTLGQIAYLLIVGMQYNLLPEEAKRCRPCTIIKHFLRVAAKVVRHARRLKVWFTK